MSETCNQDTEQKDVSVFDKVAALEADFEKAKKQLFEVANGELETAHRSLRTTLDRYNLKARQLGKPTFLLSHTSDSPPKTYQELSKVASDAYELIKGAGLRGMTARELQARLGFGLKPTPYHFIHRYANLEVTEMGGKRNRYYLISN